MVRSILDDPMYRDQDQPKIVSARIYASQLEHLTKFRFQQDSVDGVYADLYGIRGLFGGRGKDWLTSPSNKPTATFALVVQRLAEAAAYHVTHDVTATNQFFSFSTDRASQPERFSTIYTQVLSRPPTDADLSEVMELWQQVYELNESTIEAWQATLTYLFRHPSFLTY